MNFFTKKKHKSRFFLTSVLSTVQLCCGKAHDNIIMLK
jgi:hypothetical protein